VESKRIGELLGDTIVSFKFDGLRISCPASRVESVAAKYLKGFRRKTQHLLPKPTLRRPPDADALLAKLATEVDDVA
jgi:hypothetical protein